MIKKRCLLFSVALLLLLSLAGSSAWAIGPQKISVNYFYWESWKGSPTDYPVALEFKTSEEPRLVKSRVLVPLRKLADYFGYQVDYLPKSRKIKLADDLGKTMELTLGQKQATVNGRQMLLDVPAEATNGVTFVPLRFIAEGFDMAVDWQASTNTVQIYSYTTSTPKYILDKRSSSLLRRGEPGVPNQLLVDYSDQEPSWDPVMTVTTTSQDNDVVLISNCHGEPHLWTDTHYVYIANGKVVAQSLHKDSLLLDQQFSGISSDDSQVILGDGKTATVYDDRTLQVSAKYDLQALCANAFNNTPLDYQNTEYDIIGYGGTYLLLRGSLNRLHVVVYPGSGQVDVAYKEVFSSEEQKYFEQCYVDGPQGADIKTLQFKGESNGFLIFTCDLKNNGNSIEYRYQLKL
jgi:hypothetical protein